MCVPHSDSQVCFPPPSHFCSVLVSALLEHNSAVLHFLSTAGFHLVYGTLVSFNGPGQLHLLLKALNIKLLYAISTVACKMCSFHSSICNVVLLHLLETSKGTLWTENDSCMK